jgi:MFS family permease
MATAQNWQKKIDKIPKNDIVNIIVLVNAVVWYLCFFSFLKNNSGITGNNLIIVFGINLVATCLAAILSTKIIQKIENRLKFIKYWMIIGTLLSLLPLLIGSIVFDFAFIANVVGPIPPRVFSPEVTSFIMVSLISCAVGVYCGLGAPIIMGYYSATTKSAHRAKISGIIIFAISFSFIPVILLARSTISTAVVLVIWKLCGLLALFLLKPEEAKVNKGENISYKNILKSREIILYLIPWLMFSMVNQFALPALNVGFSSSFIAPIVMVENMLAGVFAVLFGFAADYFGRKRLLFLGFTMMGFGYVTLGLFPLSINALYFYTLVDGIAWGIFTTLFILTIWGDIAGEKNGEKFFVIGFLPYIFSTFLQIVFGQYITAATVSLTRVFFFLSLFLFIAVTPLYLAPETLSEKDKTDNDLKSYLKKAQKKVEKENGKKSRRKQALPLTDDAMSHESHGN